MKIAIYPGSFDPVTLGHLDVIERAAALFDRLIVVVMHNQTKKPMFTPEERQAFLRRVTVTSITSRWICSAACWRNMPVSAARAPS